MSRVPGRLGPCSSLLIVAAVVAVAEAPNVAEPLAVLIAAAVVVAEAPNLAEPLAILIAAVCSSWNRGIM